MTITGHVGRGLRLAARAVVDRPRAAPAPRAGDAPGDDGVLRTVADVRRGMLIREDRVAEHELQVTQGAWVPREQVLLFAQGLGREFRDSTLQLADQYAAQIREAEDGVVGGGGAKVWELEFGSLYD